MSEHDDAIKIAVDRAVKEAREEMLAQHRIEDFDRRMAVLEKRADDAEKLQIEMDARLDKADKVLDRWQWSIVIIASCGVIVGWMVSTGSGIVRWLK